MRKSYYLIFILSFLLGIIILVQIKAQKKTSNISLDTTGSQALEISILTKANNDLQKEIKNLQAQHEDFLQSLQDEEEIQKITQEDFQRNKIISGVSQIQGPGVEIKIIGKVDVPQLVDLINALRNIGTEGIAVNQKRINLYSSFYVKNGMITLDDNFINSPYIIFAIGNPDMVAEAVSRRGGIIEQIKNLNPQLKINVTSCEHISLPAKEEPEFKFSQVMD